MNIVFDIDGTICYDGQTINSQLTDYLYKKIHLKPDHRLIFASARPVRDILPILPKRLGDCHLIGGNGTMMYYQQKLQWLNHLNDSDAAFIINYIQEHELDYLIDEEWNYSFKGETLKELRRKVDILEKAENRPLKSIQKPVKILLANYQSQEQVIADFKGLAVNCITYPREKCLDFTNLGVNKASALAKVLQAEPYIAFGNDRNDLEMLKAASKSFGIGNNEEIMAISDCSLPENPAAIIYELEKLLSE